MAMSSGQEPEWHKSTLRQCSSLYNSLIPVCEGTQEGVEDLQGVPAYLLSISELIAGLANQTAEQAAQIDTLKGRQAISGAFQAISLVILVLWLMTLAGKAFYECCVKKVEQQQEEKHQEMVEMLEASLARRKAKRRATAKQAGDAPQ